MQLRQGGQSLTAGRSYTVAFSAKASAAHPLSVLLQHAGSPYTVHMQRDVSLATAWARDTATVTPTSTDSAVLLAFNLARATGTVWIDGVSVTGR